MGDLPNICAMYSQLIKEEGEREWKVHTSRADRIEIPNLQEALQIEDYRTGICNAPIKECQK